MKRILLFLTAWVLLYPVFGQRTLEWSVGPPQITCEPTLRICYPLRVAIADASQSPALGFSTIRFFFDRAYLNNLSAVNVQNGYTVTGVTTSPSNPSLGSAFGFLGGQGSYAQLNLNANTNNLLALSTAPVHVMDLCFDIIKPGAVFPLCAPFVFDNNPCGWDQGNGNDNSFIPGSAGLVGLYYLNNITTATFNADDEVTNFLWTPSNSFDCLINTPGDIAGTTSSTGCLESVCIPSIDIAKTASSPTYNAVGNVITYTFTVKNTSNVTLTNVSVTDPLPGLSPVSPTSVASLAPGATQIFTATYTITQANLDAGSIVNTATATATYSGNPVSDTDGETITAVQTPSIAIVKMGTFVDNAPMGANPGDVITYAFTVTNTGNVTLTNVTVTDPLVTVVGGPIASLAPGASNSTTFTASYVITQADINTGRVTNQATATGTPPTGPNVTDLSDDSSPLQNDPTITTIPNAPSISIIKTGVLNMNVVAPNGIANPGDVITYAFTVTNTGNVPLTNVTVTDPLVTVVGGPISLAPGASNNTSFTASYTITQANINAGGVTNQATATGTPPTGPNVTDLSDNNSPLENDPTVTPIPQNPSISIVKTGVLNTNVVAPNGVANPGDVITYAFTVTNTGNVPLTNVTVTDPLVTVVGGPISLAPGASNSTSFTASYTITQANINTGGVTNQATATGTPPTGPNVTDLSDNNSPLENDPTVTPIPQTPSIAIVKTGVLNTNVVSPGGVANPGDVITYSFTVTNTGNVPLTNVTVTDPLVTVVGGPISLAPGASNSTSFTASYTITQANINAGGVTNQATATGTPPTGPNVTDLSDNNSPLENDPTVTPIPQNPSIAIVKMGTLVDNAPTGANPGDVITYAFIVTNTGNVTLTNVTATDPLVTVVGGPIASLAPGASDNTTFTASYVITQADINTGGVTNQATATGTPPTGPNVTDLSDNNSPLENDPTVTPIPQNPSISIVKTGVLNTNVVAPNGVANPGDVITYAFTVTNTGNVTLTNVTVTDPLVTVVGGPIASLAPGASNSTTFTASYVISQANITAGGVTNQALATGTPPTGPNVTDLSDNNSPLENDPTVTPIPQTPSIAIVKTGVLNTNVVSPSGVANPGDVITYSFTVTNTGNVPLTNVSVTDPLVTVVGGPISLAPGASNSTSFTASYTITQANITAGGVTNQATATGTPPTGPNVTDLSDNNSPLENDPTVTPIPQTPSIAIVKTGVLNTNVVAPNGVANPGDVITYAFTVTNTGNVPLTNVTVTDPLVTVVGGPIASLAPGASNSTTFTASYVITQANINAGGVTNQATATGTPPTGPNVTDLSDNNSPLENDPTVTPIPRNPSIAIVKTGTFVDNAPTGANPGDVITYAFTVTNTGNVTLTNVTVTDPLVTVVGGPIASLAPGASDNTTFTASYVITQADINTGGVTNQATATGTPPTGPNVTDLSDDNSPLQNDPTITTIPQNPSIAIVKTGVLNTNVVSPGGVANPGDVITYAFTVTNTGNVPLTNVMVTDPLVTVVGGPISLAPGTSNNTSFTASYTITQANINAGGVTNQATATGTPPTGPNVTDLSDNNSPLENDPTVTPIPQNPSIAIVKTGVLNANVVAPNGVANPGDVITYAFTVTNTGNVPLTNVTVTDPLVTVVGGPIASLAPGASNSTTFTASYVITQANINAGGVTNQATATGTPPTGPNVTDLSDNNSPLENDPTVTPIPRNPSIAIVKTGTFVDNAPTGANPGDVITYAFTVTNTGNVTLTNVTVTDPLVTVVGGPIASLAPGASDNTTFTASYVITQADINTGGVTNQATATGTPPTGPNVTDLSDDNSPLQNDPTITTIPNAASIAIVKTGTLNTNVVAPNGVANPGDVITYAFTVTNTGNVTLTNVTVTDPLVTVVGGPIASLAPGASNSTTFTASYVITQANINAGGVTNQATATGTPPTGPNVTDLSDNNSPLENDPTVTPIPQTPSIAIVKTGVLNTNVVSPSGVANPGDVITYSFTVTNTGNVPLTNVTVTDPLVTVVGGPISLAPGASNSTSFTASYTITQANITAGGVTNQATATGTPPTGPNVTDLSDNNSPLENDPTVTPIPQTPSIAIVKTGVLNTNVVAPNGVANPGDVITYAFTVTNTGNVPLTNVTVTDPLVTVVGGPIASLAPGASNSTTFTASYVITQANINAGGVTNQATATGTPPTGPNVTDLSDNNSPLENDPTVTPIPRNPSIAIVKTGTFVDNAPTGANPGDVITYAFTVTNTGNVTLTNVTVTDPLVTVVGGPIASLAPGASDNTTFTASYVITQADINTGGVTNQATATGTPPTGPNVTDLSDDNSPLQNDPTITTIPNAASIAIVKTGTLNTNVVAPNGVANPGDVITYAFTVTNTGNVTLTNVTVTDPLVTVVGGPIASLAPGASNSTTFTASYVITQANINAGGVTNQATATGTPPTGPNVTDLSDNNSPLENDPTVTPIPQTPSIAIVKTGVLNTNVVAPNGVANPGDVITYAFTVTNTGNVPLTNVTVTDPLVTVVGGPIASLAPGASNSTTFTASYVITLADINAGGVTNQALATGTPPTGPNVTDLSDNNSPLENDPTVTPLPRTPRLSVIKSATGTVGSNGFITKVLYSIVVRNTGNVTVSNIQVTDNNGTITSGTNPIPSLLPGASATLTVEHIVTSADVTAGYVENTATAVGDSPQGTDDVTDVSDAGTFKNTTPISNPEGTETQNGQGGVDGNPTNDPTVYNLCVDWNLFVYLEGSLVIPQTGAYQAPPMRTTLNSSFLLPGQFQANIFGGGGVFTQPLGTSGQVYNIAPWNYSGSEGNAFNSGSNPANASAGYAPQVVDWVLVSLRRSPENGAEKICQRAGLLYSDGRIVFAAGTNCCALDPTESFYVVIEHRNHLIVMSHAAVPVVNGALNYDFRNKQSYLVDPLNIGTYFGQTEVSPGVFAMHAGNGEQVLNANDDVDINAADIAKWINNGAQQRTYNILDFNMDGEVSSLDFDLWERNATKFSSVPRN